MPTLSDIDRQVPPEDLGPVMPYLPSHDSGCGLMVKMPFTDQSKRKYLWDNCARLYGFGY